MGKRLVIASLVFCIVIVFSTGTSPALEKVKFATPIKMYSAYYLITLAAEEKGYWRANGLDVEWIPVGTTVAMHHAVSAGSVLIGSDAAVGMFMGISRGVPAIIVADADREMATALWVRADSPAREPKDLKKGARLSVVSMGGLDHAYGRMLLRALGMEKDVKFVATGGIPQSMAALKAGAVDATTMTRTLMKPLEVKGEVRAIARQEDYVKTTAPLGTIYWARKDFLRANREVVAKVIKALLQAHDFVNKNPRWSVEKIKSEQGLPEAAAEAVYKLHNFSKDGRLTRDLVEVTRNFLAEYELVPRDKLPPVEEFFTGEITG